MIKVDKIDAVLDELADFLNQKEAEKADIIAEEQLAQAFQNVLEERRAELIGPITLKQ